MLLLLVVRPNLGGRTPALGTFPQWARMDADAIRASMSADTRPTRIEALSISASPSTGGWNARATRSSPCSPCSSGI
ncbi:hypothetical protein [Streptomyces sp. NBC_00046]|uniref:hypothetical protein n=1 Tax=Streptomyces sp. NBC_00046 TaxID=2975626 RepID=UPI002F917ED0